MKNLVPISMFCFACLALSAQQYDPRAYISDTELGTATFYADGLQGVATASGEPYRMEAFTAAHPSYPMGSMLRVTNLDRNLMAEVRVNDRIPAQGDRLLNLSKAAAAQLGMITAGRARVRVELIGNSGNGLANTAYTASPSFSRESLGSGLTARSPFAGQSDQQPRGWAPQQQRTYNPREHGAPDWAQQLFRDEKYPAPRSGTDAGNKPASYYAPAEYARPELSARGASGATSGSPGASAATSGYAIQLASYAEAGNAESHLSQLQARGYSNAFIWQKDGKNRVVLGAFADRASALDYLARLRQQYLDGIVVQLR